MLCRRYVNLFFWGSTIVITMSGLCRFDLLQIESSIKNRYHHYYCVVLPIITRNVMANTTAAPL